MVTGTPIIFLDIDGVINSHDWWERRKGIVPRESRGLYDLDPLACLRLQDICEGTKASLVLTSTWRLNRSLAAVQKLFVQRGITAPLIGRTPSLRHHEADFEEPWSRMGRGLEVQWWLRTYLGDEGTCNAKFVCLDDDKDFGDLLGKLVQTRMATGLTDLEGDYVYKHLGESLMNSMAAGGKGRVLFEHDALTLTPWWGKQTGPFGPTRKV